MKFLRYPKEEIIADAYKVIRANFEASDADTIIVGMEEHVPSINSFSFYEAFGIGGVEFVIFSESDGNRNLISECKLPYPMIESDPKLAREIVLQHVLDYFEIGYLYGGKV